MAPGGLPKRKVFCEKNGLDAELIDFIEDKEDKCCLRQRQYGSCQSGYTHRYQTLQRWG